MSELVPIYLHEYRITAMQKKKSGIQQIKIIVQSEKQEAEGIEAVEAALQFFDQNINIEHSILLSGFRLSGFRQND